jgi:hypothetical protein
VLTDSSSSEYSAYKKGVEQLLVYFCVSKFRQIVTTDAFVEIPAHVLTRILSSDSLHVTSEMEALKGVLNWSEKNHSEPLGPMLSCIRFEYIDTTDVLLLARTNPILGKAPEFQSILEKMISYQMDEVTTTTFEHRTNYHIDPPSLFAFCMKLAEFLLSDQMSDKKKKKWSIDQVIKLKKRSPHLFIKVLVQYLLGNEAAINEGEDTGNTPAAWTVDI